MQMEEDSLLTMLSMNKIVSEKKLTILKQQEKHQKIIEDICDQVFGIDRKINRTSYQFRHNQTPVEKLCFVAKIDQQVIATIRYWNIYIGNQQKPQLLLGPIAVVKNYQKMGYAKKIIRHSLKEAQKLQYEIVILIGNYQYFAKLGFCKMPKNYIIMPENTDKNKICYHEFVKNSLGKYYGKVTKYTE